MFNHVSQDDTDPVDVKKRDPYQFLPADDFFDSVDRGEPAPRRPSKITYNAGDQMIGAAPNPACSHGRIFRFDDDSLLLVQFMRPKVWRIRFDPNNNSGADFTDFNTRTIVQATLTRMIQVLDVAEEIEWGVELHEDSQHHVLQSVYYDNCKGSSKTIAVQLWIQRDPFKITAIRSVKKAPGIAPLPKLQADTSISGSEISPPSGDAIVWQTKERGLEYERNATILSVEKPPTAKYMGFGEQGGKHLFKENTYMNFFNFDNIKYYNVYDRGPEEDAEPLYHSEPYWIEVNRHPGYMSQVATFVDNYSHVCVDLGETNASRIRLATRFNSFQCILIAGYDVGEVIRLYTSIIGRPNLMPRFILGNHQGCFGYHSRDQVTETVDRYHSHNFPLDGMHIDVDMQRNYRTFTIDKAKFPEPAEMFADLRKKGVRCCANITPTINCRPDAEYATLNEGLKGNHFVLDQRDNDPFAQCAWQQRYLQYGKGSRYFTNPKDDRRPYDDTYDFEAQFNSMVKPFHGGVDYGNNQGAPGHYPNLNSKATREWWGKQYEYLFETGLEFIWQDMTSPCMSHIYGDMKSWPFRLLLDSDGWSGDPKADEKKKAIEIWSLYSYNLHKATFKGLQKLESRKGKRNFIIGRGSCAGAQRYAGLWTGDNSSTWEFLNISVTQVIALGLAGVTIAGADVGGFEPKEDETDFADPELLIRWYCAYSLLPWFRNHYSGRHYKDEKKKLWQEPYRYQDHFDENRWNMSDNEKRMFGSVMPVCRYFIRLRYSLLQLLYDAMFENMINGLPIARAMAITDPMDGSLFSRNEWYSRSQYMVRKDLLVAPALHRERDNPRRKLYLPSSNGWYPMNLRADQGPEKLLPKAAGGSYVSYDCHIASDDSHIPFVTPMYIREGAIIPQIEARQFVPDRTRPELPEEPANPITINIYPGASNTYNMYLDDGVSRNSAPEDVYLSQLPSEDSDFATKLNATHGDESSGSNFRQVQIAQVRRHGAVGSNAEFRVKQTTGQVSSSGYDVEFLKTRRITINTPWDGPPSDSPIPLEEHYKDAQVKRDIGPEYVIVIWHDDGTDMERVCVEVSGANMDGGQVENDNRLGASIVRIPVDADVKAVIDVTYM